MLSKNNYKEKLKKMDSRKERFSIRKLSVRAASVLIGFFLMGTNENGSAKAATSNGDAGENTAEETPHEATTSESMTSGQEGRSVVVREVSQESLDNEQLNTARVNNEQGEILAVKKEVAKTVSDDIGEAVAQNLEENNQNSQVNKVEPGINALTDTETTLRGTQTQEVSDWQGFVNAMNDANIGTIKLTADITVSKDVSGISTELINSTKLTLQGSNISGGLIIDGQNHAINFGDFYLSFSTNNQKNSAPWDITFKNLTINANGRDNSYTTYGGAFSPFYMGGDSIDKDLLAKNKVTFENITATVKNGAFFNTGMQNQVSNDMYTTVTFKGNNNITCEAVNVSGNQNSNYASAVSVAHIIFAEGTDTVFNVSSAKTNNSLNPGGNILRTNTPESDTDPAIDVKAGATVTLNGLSTDVKGILTDKAITGTVQVDGTLNANMADGHSMAIWAGNLNIGKTGVVDITTKQNNDGSGANGVTNYNGYHFAPISLGVGLANNLTNSDANTLNNEGKLTIKRTGDNKSTSPLISFGSGASAVQNGTFTLNVTDGATLDLQDSAQSSIAGATTNTPNIGLITMWGSGSSSTSNNINITNPAYVNLQRTGNQTGTLIRLENMNNHVNIQSNGAGNPLPLAQWDEANKGANPSHYWYVNDLKSQNNWGDYSISGFAGKGQSAGEGQKGEAKFLNSNGTVTLGGSQAGLNQYQYMDGTITQGQPNPGVDYETPYLNQFLNTFNWWTPQRIAMGSALEQNGVNPTDSEKYQPKVQEIKGNTGQTLADLTAKDGIKDLLVSDGTTTEDLSVIKDVTWYDPTSDAEQWKNVMGDEAAPTNPTGNLKTTDKSAWAKVTYQDGTIDFVNIPLSITEPMTDTYTPSYNPVSVEQGMTATSDPSFTDKDNNKANAPDGTKYTLGTDAPTWATVGEDGKVTVSPDANVTPGAYNIPVTVTYPDNSMDEVTVPVIVTKAGQTVTWGDNGAIVTTVDTSKLGAHETTDNSQVLSPAGLVTAQGYELKDGMLSATPTDITVDSSTVMWGTTPDTTVETATADGKKVPATIQVDFTNNDVAKNILGSKDGKVTTEEFTIDALGAGAKEVATPVEIKIDSDLTADQFNQLVNNNIPTDQIASTAWSTKPDKDGNNGVIRITFNDNDANGQPTYLDIAIPASSIKITTNDETNKAEGQDVVVKPGETPAAPDGIKNKDDLPDGTTYEWKEEPDTTEPGNKPAVIVVTYPDGTTEEVQVNVVVNAEPVVKPITTTVGSNPSALDGIANLNNGGTSPVEGYPSGVTWVTAPDTSKVGDTTGIAEVTYPNGSKVQIEIPVKVTDQLTDADTYDPKAQEVNTTIGKVPEAGESISNKADLPEKTTYTWRETPDVSKEGKVEGTVVVTYPDNSTEEVTVTINVTDPRTDADKYTPVGQDVTVKTGETPEAAAGIANTGDLPTGTKYEWKEVPDTITAGDKSATVVVTYPDGTMDEVQVTVKVTDKETDADKYSPEGQDINTETGKVPDPSDGIKNKGDLPEGTKYNWKETPDTTTAGDKPATILVTYPDGSYDEVQVTIHVTDSSTDADKYSPEGQDINTETGKVPDPSDGIKNKGDLPEGTKYNWKETPDTTTAGDKTATVVVTYPDGSMDEVSVTIHVTNPSTPVTPENPSTPTDAEKNNPQGQNVNTTVGKTPDASAGIANKDDMPSGTTYTWETTPDVTTIGTHPAVIVVTYPDGSQDRVTVNVVVTNPTPMGQDVDTTPGNVPNPGDGIANKDEMPDGTEYTWKDTPDTTTPGTHPATIVVRFPDGTTQEVTINIVVKDNSSDNNSNNGNNNNSNGGNQGNQSANNGGMMNNANSGNQGSTNTAAKEDLPQTGSQNTTAFGAIGLAIASIGSLFGLAAGKKKKD